MESILALVFEKGLVGIGVSVRVRVSREFLPHYINFIFILFSCMFLVYIHV